MSSFVSFYWDDKSNIAIGIIFFLSIYSFGCNSFDKQEKFRSLRAEVTGVKFSNDIISDEQFNVITHPFIYNGGGVAIGDINNDGLPDIYFSGNQVSSRLYLNKGDLTFQDITESSGTSTFGWAGGVSMADINNDGFLDIYVSVSGSEGTTPEERKNLLFINNGDLTFTERAEEYGIADTRFIVHAAFFDFDIDGDLDLFLINNFPGSFARDMVTGLREETNDGSSPSTDALYRNNGDGTFTEISDEAGILKEGYSLGIAVTDINRDGWPDVYISNDVQTDDLLYVNMRDGSFEDKSAEYFKHTSYAGMGTDVADFNNDGWQDLLQVDMMPPNLGDQQLVSGTRNYEYLQELEEKGYQVQNNANTLQLSNGINEAGNVVFSEIGHMAGIEATEWSWTGLFGDYDNDGLKDILITNGYPKAINNYDYIMDLNRASMFGTDSTREQATFEILDNLHSLHVSNYFFKNNGDLTFKDVSETWGFTDPTFSYGAAHADLDNDGDLDIVINNLNESAEILENRSDSVNYLSVKLQGDSSNTGGIGAKLTATIKNRKQHAEFWPFRGYQSTMNNRVHFGLGEYSRLDSLEIVWPDGKYQVLKDVTANRTLVLDYSDASFQSRGKETNRGEGGKYFKPAEDELKIHFNHKENQFVDFDNEVTLPEMGSRMGTPIAVADVDNDQREDIYIGGPSGMAGILYIQQEDDSYKRTSEQQTWIADRQYEDTDAVFTDVNGDGLQDLYIASGGNEFSPASALLQDRLYINIGEGKFIKDENSLPRMFANVSVAAAGDYDGDGDADFFIGGRHVPGQYPSVSDSYLLRNDNGVFKDVTEEKAAELKQIGEVTDAVWADTDGDGDQDLVITGWWKPVVFFENTENRLVRIPGLDTPQSYRGWWSGIEKGDLNGDGNIDFVVGNMGLNHAYTTPGSPDVHLFADDFDGDHQLDPVFAKEVDGEYRSLHSFRTMAELLPRQMQLVRSFERYAGVNLRQLIGQEPESVMIYHTANYFSTSVLINQGENEFDISPLPVEAQVSAVKSIEILDINEDEMPDLILTGNEFDTNPELPRMDAGNGLLLIGQGTGRFEPISPFQSGLTAPENVKSSSIVHTIKGRYLLIVNNNSSAQTYKILSSDKE